jgi:glycine dehydrogenase subunit 1
VAYLSVTADEREKMLRAIGVASTDDLFEQIPATLRLDRPLDLPPAMTEIELESHLSRLASRSPRNARQCRFLGGGAYDHFIPSAVDAIASRSEFYTAYTPYQAEASQGSLQAFFEYQTLICQLTGMDVSNASLYEGGTAVSEAVFMAMRATERHRRVVILGSVHPEYIEVCQTYLAQLNCELVVVPTPDGVADPSVVRGLLDDQTACLVFQQPNFFGNIEQVADLADAARSHGALAIVSFDPISLGLLARPGDYGVDIAVAEGQSLGIPLQYGGPYLGILACRQQFVRKMPGRLIGETIDREGRRAYVLCLQAREQHIRREKATSNICTNQGLMALRATVYLSLLGSAGLREVAELCTQKAHYAAERLTRIPGIEPAFDRPFFKEFTLRCPGGARKLIAKARAAGIDIGPELSRFRIAGLDRPDQCILLAVTEKRTREEIDRLVDVLA